VTETVDLAEGILRIFSCISLKMCGIMTSWQSEIRVLQKYRSCRFRIAIVHSTEIVDRLEVRYGDDNRSKARELRDSMPALSYPLQRLVPYIIMGPEELE
jgi:hypothetical protein